MDGKRVRVSLLALATLLACLLAPTVSRAGPAIELSGMVAYSKSDYGDDYRSMQRRYTGSIDFKFTPVSALQFEYTDSLSKISYQTDISKITGGSLEHLTLDATTYRDKIYSFNWVQNLVPSTWILQPYFVIGGGKMRRTYTRELPEFAIFQTAVQNVTTGTGGLGLRIFITRNMALKGEVKTYVPNFQFSKWKESQQFSAGLSWAF